MKKIFLIIFLGGLLFPLASLADGTYFACQDVNENWKCEPTETGRILVYYQGLVPCGKEVCRIDTDKVDEIKTRLAAGDSFQTACQHASVAGSFVRGEEIRPPGGQPYYLGVPCQLCHFVVMADGIIDFLLFQLVPVIAVLMLVIGGAMYLFAYFGEGEILPGGAGGGPKLLGQAKKLFSSVVIGLIIIYAGWLLIDLFFKVIGAAEWTGLQSGWFSIKCTAAVYVP